MANDRINVWLKMRDVARFVRDAKIAEHSIKGMANAAKDGEGPFGALGSALGTLSGALPKARTETGILGLTLGSLVTLVIAGAPLFVAFAGATVALAGSFGQAALGAGALGVALAGAALPLGALGLVAAQAFQGFTKVNTAFAQWNVQVAQYGRNSQQAETALGRLNAVAAQFGGNTMIRLVQQWDRFQKLFRSANAPALGDLIKVFSLFLDVAEQLLPVFSKMAKVASGALLDAFQTLATVLTGHEFLGLLDQLTITFSNISGPLAQAVINFFMGLLNIAARLGPALEWFVGQVLDLSEAFLNWGRSGSMGILVDQFKAWWGLIKAVGGLLLTILGGGAEQGKGLVVQLTTILNRWNAWLKTTAGQKSMAKFFRDAIELTKLFVGGVFKIVAAIAVFGRAMMPIYIKALKGFSKGVHEVIDALEPMQPFLKNVLVPLLRGAFKGALAGLIGAFKLLVFVIRIVSTILGAFGTIMKPFSGVFEAVGYVIGFVFGGELLSAMAVLSKFTIVLKPLSYLFKALALPIKGAGELVSIFGGKFLDVAAKIGMKIGTLRGVIMDVVKWLYGAGAKFYNAGVWMWTKLRQGITRAIGQGLGFAADIGKAVYNFVARLINKGIPNSLGPINLPNNPIPMLAAGGVVSGSGSWITGEAGPEVNTLRNGKVTVVPLSPAVSAQSASATLAPSEKRVMVAKVYLRGKQIAEAVADEAEDEKARR